MAAEKLAGLKVKFSRCTGMELYTDGILNWSLCLVCANIRAAQLDSTGFPFSVLFVPGSSSTGRVKPGETLSWWSEGRLQFSTRSYTDNKCLIHHTLLKWRWAVSEARVLCKYNGGIGVSLDTSCMTMMYRAGNQSYVSNCI